MLSERLDYIVALFQEAGITHWFVSPGSRNAPIVAALIRGTVISPCTVHSQMNVPVPLPPWEVHYNIAIRLLFYVQVAPLLANAYPAVLEAYYQRVPLLIVSADRPEDRIDQWDGQTIRQNNFFGELCPRFLSLWMPALKVPL